MFTKIKDYLAEHVSIEIGADWAIIPNHSNETIVITDGVEMVKLDFRKGLIQTKCFFGEIDPSEYEFKLSDVFGEDEEGK